VRLCRLLFTRCKGIIELYAFETKMMSPKPNRENERWTVRCQDAADGTGDLIVPLPDDLLSEMGLVIGDTLSVEKQADGTFSLTKVSEQSEA
jgi:hypothetical protein